MTRAGSTIPTIDSYDHYVRSAIRVFVYGIAEAQTVGHTVLSMETQTSFPAFGFTCRHVDGYVTELQRWQITNARA